MGFTVKDFSQDKEYRYELRIFISDKEDNNLIFLKSDASIYKDINSINIITRFDKGIKSYPLKYELLKIVLEFCESYEEELDKEFEEPIEEYDNYLKSDKLSIDEDYNI